MTDFCHGLHFYTNVLFHQSYIDTGRQVKCNTIRVGQLYIRNTLISVFIITVRYLLTNILVSKLHLREQRFLGLFLVVQCRKILNG